MSALRRRQATLWLAAVVCLSGGVGAALIVARSSVARVERDLLKEETEDG